MEIKSVTIDDKPIERLPIPGPAPLFSTPDLHEVAFLLARGRRVVEMQHRDRYRFFFERTSELEADLSDFHGNAQVGIRDFISAMYSAKRMMREEAANRR